VEDREPIYGEGWPHRGASVPAVRPPRRPALPRRRRPPLGFRGGGAEVAGEARRRCRAGHGRDRTAW
jgi:hypothetical protein